MPRGLTAILMMLPCAVLWTAHRVLIELERLCMRIWWWRGCQPLARRLLSLQLSARVWRVFLGHLALAWRDVPREGRPPGVARTLRAMRACLRH
jgi:hypothetical protein